MAHFSYYKCEKKIIHKIYWLRLQTSIICENLNYIDFLGFYIINNYYYLLE